MFFLKPSKKEYFFDELAIKKCFFYFVVCYFLVFFARQNGLKFL